MVTVKLWKRNAVMVAIVLFVGAAVYLNWSYAKQDTASQDAAASGKILGEAALVSGRDGTAETASVSEDGTDGGTAETGYFSTARLNRQQARDSALELLQEAAADTGADQETINEANTAAQAVAANTLSESNIENLVTAKGYTDCVCFLGDDSASVVVASTTDGLTAADTAKITEIVMQETGLNAAQVKIIEADP